MDTVFKHTITIRRHVISPQRDTGIASLLDEDAVVLRDALCEVGQERVLATPKAALVPGRVGEGQVGEGAVHADADNLCAEDALCMDYTVY